MTPVVLITAEPRNAADGTAVTVRLAGGGNRKPYRYGGQQYRAGVATLPRFKAEIAFDESGWTGGVRPGTGTIVWAPAGKAALAELAAYVWKSAVVTVQEGDEETGTFATRLTGKVADAAIQDHKLVITIADLGADLDKPLVTARFAGTGGAEGGTEANGRIKRRTWGRAFNIEGRILDKANSIYEFGDPAFPWQSFETVRDMGRDADPAPAVIAWAGSVAATLAALIASSPAQGSCAVAPSIACCKWWTQPAGPLTADVKGEIGAGYVETAPSIAERILAAAAGPAITNVAAANGWRGDVAGIHVAEDETVASAIDRLVMGISLLWILDPAGTVTFREITFTAPIETLRSDTVNRLRSFRPTKLRRVGYQKGYRTHSEGEIASSLLVDDIVGLGDLATLDNVKIGPTGRVVETDGFTPVTDANYRTEDGTAAFIAGQSIFATATEIRNIDLRPGTIADNVIPNPLFQDGNAKWNYHGGWAYVAAAAGDPAPAMARNIAPAGTAYLFANSAVSFPYSAPRAHVSIWLKSTTALAAPTIYVRCLDAAGTTLGNRTLAVGNTSLNTWQNVGGFVPNLFAGTAKVEVFLETYASAGTVYATGLRVAPTQLGADVTTDQPVVDLLNDTTGVATDSRILPSNVSFALIPSLKDAVTISDTDNAGTVTLNIGSAVFYPDVGGTVTFPSGTLAGKAYATKYYIKRTGVNPISAPTGTAWDASTTLSIGVGDVYVNHYTTRATGGTPSPPPPPPPGGGFDCVAADAWVETRDRGFVRAFEIVAGDMLRVLTSDRRATTWAPCTGNSFASEDGLLISSSSGVTVRISASTPITCRDGAVIRAAAIDGHELPILIDGEALVWETCRVEPAGRLQVAHILCGQHTYAAGDVAGRAILTHNPKP